MPKPSCLVSKKQYTAVQALAKETCCCNAKLTWLINCDWSQAAAVHAALYFTPQLTGCTECSWHNIAKGWALQDLCMHHQLTWCILWKQAEGQYHGCISIDWIVMGAYVSLNLIAASRPFKCKAQNYFGMWIKNVAILWCRWPTCILMLYA